MPGLGTTFGRGGATTYPRDLAGSDCILIMGSNMAEAHPVAFRWVVDAKERGANVIHVDPHFSRTSALATMYAPIRSGSDTAFLGGLISYILEHNGYFREYVVAYTNAANVVDDSYQDTEDLEGLFSGYDPETRTYDDATWRYRVEAVPGSDGVTRPMVDPTLTDPRCVFQILRRHFARYTPDVVEEICGTPREQFCSIAQSLIANSGRDRTSAICYAVGWTQHSKGAQTIRAAAIIQLLLGNIGRPGGGIMALRGHASIQGSTDVPTLYDLLAGYMPQPSALRDQQTIDDYLATSAPRTGVWANLPRYLVSLLKAWYGDAATADNEYCYAHVPKTVGDHSHLATTFAILDGHVKGTIVMGQNPAGGSGNARLQRKALGKLDWLVVRDLYETETARFWNNPVDGVDPATIDTEVFFLPAAGPGEKAGCFTNTQRLIQWKEKAVDPPGDARSDAWFIHAMARRLKELYASSTLSRDRPIQDLWWDFDSAEAKEIPGEPDIERVLQEINGFTWNDRRQLADASELRDDGTTACGSWIYTGVYPVEATNRAASRVSDGSLSPDWGFAWPANRRILYNRASADPDGRPWSERKRYIWWDDEAKRWVGHDVPDFPVTKAPTEPGRPNGSGLDALGGSDPFIMKEDGKGWLFAPTGLADGPLPTHYEPAESPVGNYFYPDQRSSPVAKFFRERKDNPLAMPGDERYPIVLTTYRLTEHHVSGPMSRWLPWLNALQPELFVELSPELAKIRQIANRDWVTIVSARGAIEAKALVTRRVQPFQIRGKRVHQVGLPFHWGYQGAATGSIANDLTHLVLEPNVSIYEVKALMVDVRPGRLARKGDST